MGALFAAAGATLVEHIGVAGLDVLDVATGTGNTARAAARAGARRVVGVDATPALLAEATRRSVADGTEIEWQEGDMEDLALADASFDRVLSSFGAMFATDQHHMAAELERVCRPGGRVGLTAWAVVSARFPSPEAAVELFETRAAPIMAAQRRSRPSVAGTTPGPPWSGCSARR
ncbi:MAG: class I SAM-dependent methyltransferase [Actinobacteria bacterium]|nr:class I SAM-dependent methyltransferase [Actinomycetota bacterium]